MIRWGIGSVFLVIIFLQIPLSWAKRGASTETHKPLYQRLRRLNQQFKRFQQMTLTHLQSIAENYNVSYNIDARFQVLSRQFKSISREFRAFKATVEQDLNSLKSWTKNLQKKTKRLDSRLVNMMKTLKDNNNLSHSQIQNQRAVLANMTQEIQKQQSRIDSLESLGNKVQGGMRDLQNSVRRHQTQIMQLEGQIKRVFHYSPITKAGFVNLDSVTSKENQQSLIQGHPQPKPSKKHSIQATKDKLSHPRPTKQPQTYFGGKNTRDRQQGSRQILTLPTARAEEEPQIQKIFQLPFRQKIPHNHTPKEEAKICNVGSMLLFPSASTKNYATFQRTFRTGTHELSICTWLRVDAKNVGTILSYATEINDNMLVLYGRNSSIPQTNMDFIIGDPAYRELSVEHVLDGQWHHLCIIWSSIEGKFWYYLDSHLVSTGSRFQKGYEIPPGGSVVLGQEQDSVGGDFDEAEAFVGRLAGFAVWTWSLSPLEVSGLATGRGFPRGAVLSLDDVDQIFGSVQHITCECLEHCM